MATVIVFYPQRPTTTSFRSHGGEVPTERGRRDTAPKKFPRQLPYAEEGRVEDVKVVLPRIGAVAPRPNANQDAQDFLQR